MDAVTEEIAGMIRSAQYEGPQAVLRVSRDRYEWLRQSGDQWSLSLWSDTAVARAALGVEVVVDPSLSGMDYLVDPRP